MRQEILMLPQGDKTYVKLSSNITLKRYIPFFMAEYARKQVKAATVDSIQKMEYVIRNLGKQNEV